jgi:hypothetical protein
MGAGGWSSRVFVSVLLFVVAGCGAQFPDASQLPADVQDRVATFPLYAQSDVPDRKAIILKKVSGLACIRAAVSYTRFTREAAETGLKIDAVQASADAAVNVECKTGGMDLGTNCWASIACTGDAVRFVDRP